MPTGEDLVGALFERVRQSAHAVSFARSLFDHRDEYQHAVFVVRTIERTEAHDEFVQALSQAYADAREDLAHVEYRTDLVRQWMLVLVDALKRVDVPELPRTSPRPFHELLDDEDIEIMEIDRRDDSDLGARGIAEAWQA
jgi:hypothetical protein